MVCSFFYGRQLLGAEIFGPDRQKVWQRRYMVFMLALLRIMWIANHVYCNLCGHDWAAVYDDECTRLECPACHGDSRVNVINDGIAQ